MFWVEKNQPKTASAIARGRGEQRHEIGNQQTWGDSLRDSYASRLFQQMPQIKAVGIRFD